MAVLLSADLRLRLVRSVREGSSARVAAAVRLMQRVRETEPVAQLI